MREAKNVFVGFGKAGKTLAFKLASAGESVILIEQSELMYGGTCINVGCIPSKLLYTLSDAGAGEPGLEKYRNAVLTKKSRIGTLRGKNLHKVADLEYATVLTGQAHFEDDHTITVTYQNGLREEVRGERIFINTGATPSVPDTPGLATSRYVVKTDALMDQEVLPKELVIIGGGYIAAEFATTYAQFGAHVTMLIRNPNFMSFMEREAAAAIHESLTDLGVDIRLHATVTEVTDGDIAATLTVNQDGQVPSVTADTILIATGRHANIDGLGLENTHVLTNERGILVDDQLRTAAPNVWALGDVRGGAQHTYISLDDSRIIMNQLRGDGHATLAQQAVTPSVVFTNPPMATIGLNQEEADAQGIHYRMSKMAVAALPKTYIAGNTRGYMKALVDDNDHIIGATLFAIEAHEMINLISMAMHNNLPYQTIRDQIFAHPTMSEGLNDLFEGIPEK